MLNTLYNLLNTVSITAWIVVIYVLKEQWTFDPRVHFFFVSVGLIVLTIGGGTLSLFLTKFLDKDNLEKCVEVEQADASFLPTYVGYFLVAFSISNLYQLLVAFVCISIFLYLVRWQYFNITYLFFGYHCYHVTTDTRTQLFLICQQEIRTPDNIRFDNLRRINNTTYIERRIMKWEQR